jgi:hypothetical protein
LDAEGKIVALSELGSEIPELVVEQQTLFVATADGQLRRIAIPHGP